MDSILYTIKKMLGLEPDYRAFDAELTVFINNAFVILEQLGVGAEGFGISGEIETWDQFLADPTKLESAKTYVYIRTRLMFDPPSNSNLTKVLEDTARELEWRLQS